MNIFITMFKKESLEIYKSKKLLIMLIVFAFVAISSPIIAKLIPELLKNMPDTPGLVIQIPAATWQDSVTQLIKNISQFGFLLIIFMFAGSIADEKNKKTLELVLTKPVSRTNIVLSKFFASTFFIKIVYIAAMITFYFYTVSIFGHFSVINFLWLALFVLVYLLLALATTIFFSVIANSQVIATGLTFITSIIFTIVTTYIKQISDYSPAYIISNFDTLMADGKIHNFLPPFYASLGLIVLLVSASVLFFRRQEIER